MKSMRSTEMILDITEDYGEDRKQELTRELKRLRLKVRDETLYYVRRGIYYAGIQYKNQGPDQKINNNHTEHAPQTGINLVITDENNQEKVENNWPGPF